MSNFEPSLPKWYHGTDGIRYEEPAYRVIGNGVFIDDTLWLDGEEILYDGIPNEAMEPLNESAEIRMHDWLMSLPGEGRAKYDDIVQAAWELRPKEGMPELALADFSGAVVKRAIELRSQREGRAPAPGSVKRMPKADPNVPPMSNISYGESARPIVPGPRKDPTVTHMPQRERARVQKLPPVMGNLRPAGSQQPTS